MTKRRKIEPYRVFVSHATADKWIARMICEKIDAIKGAKSFRDDRDIAGGDSIDRSIAHQIQKCDEFVVLLSPQSIKRIWVTIEIGGAWILSKRIVPVYHNVSANVIPLLSMSRGYTLNDFDAHLLEIEAICKRRL